jgi:hypothetical protein
MLLAATLLLWGPVRDAPGIAPRDPSLRAWAVRIYTPSGSATAPRAVLVFFGNDLGFWRPHRLLAADLAGAGYAVAGIDIVRLLANLPDDSLARDSIVHARTSALIAHAYRELASVPYDSSAGRPRIPLVLVGHSLGAELALFAGAGANTALTWPADVPRIDGVVALSPGSRSHLRVAATDLLMTAEPTEPGSFPVAGTVGTLVRPPSLARVAIVRGGHDKLASADPALLLAGGACARRFVVPMAGHSLARLAIARFVVRQAITWVLASEPAGHAARGEARRARA